MRVRSYAEFLQQFSINPKNGDHLFRGIGGQHKLLPSIANSGVTDIIVLKARAAKAQEIFNAKFRELHPKRNFSNYQLAFLGRHCGLISPFMDFTFNDTIAIQFGMEASGSGDLQLFRIDITSETINTYKDGIPDSTKFQIFNPHLVWDGLPFPAALHTQLVQNAKLIAQSAETWTTPFDETFQNKITCYEIFNEDFDQLKNDILGTGINMVTDLLIDQSDPLFTVARDVNAQVLDEIK